MADPGPIPGLPGIHLRRPRGIANWIKLIVTHPCADPWFVLIETFIPAALKLGWTLTAPDWEDLLRAYASSYARIPNPQRIPGRKGHAAISQLSLYGAIDPAAHGKALRLTLFLTKPLETLGWWWLVWNATDQFWMDWHSLLIRNNYCSASTLTGPYQAHDDDSAVTFSGVDWPVACPIEDQNRAGWSHTAFSVQVPAGIYTVVFQGSWPRAADLPPLPGCQLVVECTGTVPGLGRVESEEFTLPQGGSGGTVMTAKFYVLSVAGGTITWYTRGQAGVGATLHGQARIIVFGE